MPRKSSGTWNGPQSPKGQVAPRPGPSGLFLILAFAALLVPLLPEAKPAHLCYNERRWTDTAGDGSITRLRCLLSATGDTCLSAVDKRPWSQDTLLAELLGLVRERAFAALVRIDSVRSSYRDSAYVVDGVSLVDRHMMEDAYLTVMESYKGDVETGPLIFEERWNMGNVQSGTEYASFFPGRGQWYLAFYDPGARLGELVRPATECNRNLTGFRVEDGRIAKSGEYAFPQLSIPLDLFKSSLHLASVRQDGRRGRTWAAQRPGLRAGRAGGRAGTRLQDVLGREQGGEAGDREEGRPGFGIWIESRKPHVGER
jgi:hypothetical protein